MPDYISIPIHRSLYNEFILRKGQDVDVAGWIEDIVDGFLQGTEADAQIWSDEHHRSVLVNEAIEKELKTGDPKLGLYWQYVFLPNGTELRMKYQGKNHIADVRHEKLFYKKTQCCSPSEFASLVANKTSRNAWRDIWIKRPGDKDWTFADNERRRGR